MSFISRLLASTPMPLGGKQSVAAALAGTIVLISSGGASATDIYLKFPGLPGESVKVGHAGDIELKAFTTSASNTATLSGTTAGKIICGQVTIVKLIDKASPQLLGLLFSGRHTPGPVTVTFDRTSEAAGGDYYKVDLQNVLVTSVVQNDSETDTIRETVTMIAQRFVYTYRPLNANGSLGTPVTTGWDCIANSRV